MFLNIVHFFNFNNPNQKFFDWENLTQELKIWTQIINADWY